MPKLVDVPGTGVVEFPDDMDDVAVGAAIKKSLQPAAPSQSQSPGPVERSVFGNFGAAGTGTESAEPPSAARRLVQGVDRSTFPTGSLMDPVRAVGHMIAHPIDTVSKIHESGVERMTSGFAKTLNVMSGDRPVNVDRTKDTGAVEDIIAGAVPVLGPMAQDMLTRAFGGDVAGATGELIGTLAMNKAGDAVVGAGKAGLRSARGTKAPLPTAEVPGSTVPYKGPLTRAEETGSGVRQSLERIPESSPFAGSFWKPFRSEQQAALKTMGDAVIDKVRGAADSGGDVVKAMGEAIKEAKGKASAAVSKMYDAVDKATAGTPQQVQKTVMVDKIAPDGSHYKLPTTQTVTQSVGGVRPSMAPLKSFAESLLKKYEASPAKAPAGLIDQLQRVMDMPDDVGFADMHNARSSWRAATRDSQLVATETKGVVKQLSKMADASMRSAAKASGKPNVIKALDAAGDAHAEVAFVFNKSLGAKVAKAAVARKDPSAITALLKQAGTSHADVAAIRAIVPESMLRSVKATMVSDMLESAWKPHADVARAGGGAVAGAPLAPSGAGQALSGATLDSALTKLKKSPAGALLSTEEAANLGNVARVARAVTPKASKVLQGFMLGAGSLGTMAPGGVASVAGAGATMAAMSYIITQRPGAAAATAFLRAADKAVKATAKGGAFVVSPEMRVTAARLHQLAVEEEKKKGRGAIATPAPGAATPTP